LGIYMDMEIRCFLIQRMIIHINVARFIEINI
jgi:hypothetical protein